MQPTLPAVIRLVVQICPNALGPDWPAFSLNPRYTVYRGGDTGKHRCGDYSLVRVKNA